MSLFLDNDVLEKLASWQLLDEGVQACGGSPDSVRVLLTLKFRLGLAGKKRRTKYPKEVLERIRSFLGTVQECAEAPPAGRAALVDVPNLDAGEVILFAHAAETVGSLLLTGDKRSIEAVANVPECAGLAQDLAGRVLCMEQVLLRVIDAQGFDTVKFRIVNSNALHLDTAVRAAFGFDGVDSTREQPPVSCRSGPTTACRRRLSAAAERYPDKAASLPTNPCLTITPCSEVNEHGRQQWSPANGEAKDRRPSDGETRSPAAGDPQWSAA